ncbi:hypothetical protein D3C83_12430 [compost metagenome]
MRDDRPHLGRFADDARQRLDARTLQVGNQPSHADAAHFLVVSERDVKRRLQPTLHEFRQQCQHAGEETLHVGSTAAVEPAVLLHHIERIGLPGLPFHRHDVGMARQDDARLAARAQRREQVGLALRVVVRESHIRVVRLECVADELDQLEIGVAAHRRKGNELAQHLDAGAAIDLAGIHDCGRPGKVQHR